MDRQHAWVDLGPKRTGVCHPGPDRRNFHQSRPDKTHFDVPGRTDTRDGLNSLCFIQTNKH